MRFWLGHLRLWLAHVLDWSFDHPIAAILLGVAIVAALTGLFVLCFPCTGTGPGECPIYCGAVDYEGNYYTYVCGWRECVVCTERSWRWSY